MIRKILFAGVAAGLLVMPFTRLFAAEGGTTIGGHIKLTAYDYKDGKMNGIKGHQYAGMRFSGMYLYIASELTDKISVDLQPQFDASSTFDASTGATPRFGTKLQESKNPSVEPVFSGWVKAVVKIVLPRGYELSAGIVKPRFTMEYGAELFWEDEFNGSKFAINKDLGAMKETGVELYKPYELGPVSLPAYLYIVNGNGTTNTLDNNNSPMVMLHAEPEIGAWKFFGSLGRGKYDDSNKLDNTRYSFGAAYDWNNFSVRSEYAGSSWEKSIRVNNPDNTTTISDAIPWGYYVKAFYKVTPWARLMLHYNYVDNNFSGGPTTAGSEIYTTITPGIQLRVMSSSSIITQFDIADWKQKDAKGAEQTLKFNRLTVGWRTTF